ncbi:MAG: HAD family hydrolase [Deltaproteobacteria bacterium]|nr:HAD family hydrolase [Deltaproteobacteria bacterium]
MNRENSTQAEPRAEPKALILCDFDGTVSIRDTVNRLVRDHVYSAEWRHHVKRYLRGEIGSRGVYEAVAPLMRMTERDLEEFVRRFALLDPHFPAFLDWARSKGIDVKIVSDGFDGTIRTLFRDHGIDGLDVFANALILEPNGQVHMASPHADPECGVCGTCKLGVLKQFRPQYDKIILIGDGESDRHVASHADLVIGLKDLFVYCARESLPSIRADGFRDVPLLLTRRIEAVTFDMDGTLVDSIDTIVDAFNHMFVRMGYPTMSKEEVVRKTSISLVDFVHSYLKPHETEEAIGIFREYYDAIYMEKTGLLPGVLETLENLDGAVIAGVVTNKRGPYARRLAQHLGFSRHMTRIIGAQDGFKAKPSGEMFEEFVKSAGTNKETTIYVGDAPLDVQAAANAGIDCYAIANSIFSAEELAISGARRVLSHISELPNALGPEL